MPQNDPSGSEKSLEKYLSLGRVPEVNIFNLIFEIWNQNYSKVFDRFIFSTGLEHFHHSDIINRQLIHCYIGFKYKFLRTT